MKLHSTLIILSAWTCFIPMRLFVSKWKNVLKGIPIKGRIRRLPNATGWPMINFKVTRTAKEMLKEMIRKSKSEHGYKSLVPAILWGRDVGKKDFEWGVGFYERSRIVAGIVADWIVVLDEVEFYIDPVDLPKLDGQTLDYVNNRFKVVMLQKH